MNQLQDRHRKRLRELEQDGRLEAAWILKDARPEEAVLHDLFDWDRDKMAEVAWLDRSREIIRLYRVRVHETVESYDLSRYVRDPAKNANQQGYIDVGTLREDKAASRRALQSAVEFVVSALKRARRLSVALGLEAEFDDMLATTANLRRLLAEAPVIVVDAEVLDDNDGESMPPSPPAPPS